MNDRLTFMIWYVVWARWLRISEAVCYSSKNSELRGRRQGLKAKKEIYHYVIDYLTSGQITVTVVKTSDLSLQNLEKVGLVVLKSVLAEISLYNLPSPQYPKSVSIGHFCFCWVYSWKGLGMQHHI